MSSISNQTVSYSATQDLGALRRGARENSPEALKAVAKQFEAMFINMLLKNSRASALAEDVLGGDKNDIYNDMHDQQIAQQLAQRGIGIADMLVRQLGGRAGQQPVPGLKPSHKPVAEGFANPPATLPRAARIDVHL